MMLKNTSARVRRLLRSTLEAIASDVVHYNISNWNTVVQNLTGSPEDKNMVKEIASDAFDAGN